MSRIFHPRNSGDREPTSRQARRELVDLNRNLDDSDLVIDVSRLFEVGIMAQDNTEAIYKALRMVPDFDGNPNILTRFISICDQIVASFMSTEAGSELSNLCLINGILNKITGTASCTINSNGIPGSWLGIRTALINNFSDQRDETALYNDLSIAMQGDRTPQEFYEHCQTLLSTVMTYVSLHETIASTIEAKRSLYKRVATQAFVRGLNEPLGSRIRCMRPESIEKALEYVQEELNVIYLQQRVDVKVQQSPRMTTQFPNVGILPPRPNYQPQAGNWQVPIGQRPPPPAPQPFKFNPVPAPPQNRMPSRTQQMFRALPPNYNPRSNVFRLQPRNNPPFNSGPKPMSGVQHYAPRVLPSASNNFYKSQEMHINECAPYDYESYYSGYYAEPEYYSGACHDDGDNFNYYYSMEHYNVVDPVNNCIMGEEEEPQPSTSSNGSRPYFRKGPKSRKQR